NIRVEPRDQPLEPLADVIDPETRREEADTAIDVVADAARGDHSLVDVERRDAADREAVAPMDVGHADRRPDDPRKTGDVRDLLDRSVVADVLHEPVVREDNAVRQHRADSRDPKASRIHLLTLDLT